MLKSDLFKFFMVMEMGVLMSIVIWGSIQHWSYKEGFIRFLIFSLIGNILILFKFGCES